MTFSNAWLGLVKTTREFGERVEVRGKMTRETLQRTIHVNMRNPVLMVPNRKMSYTFALAESHWILTGDNRVETIKPYNARIADFSDDGKVFFGAYGPKIMDQIKYVVDKLCQDSMTRQAGLNIWRENPPDTKDLPCTIAMFFNIRKGQLNAHVFMRSSDIWLGIPYDVFNFSMVAHAVCALYNTQLAEADGVSPGTLYLTAASSHLYETDMENVNLVLNDPGIIAKCLPTPEFMYKDPRSLIEHLEHLKNSPPTSKARWWNQEYLKVSAK